MPMSMRFFDSFDWHVLMSRSLVLVLMLMCFARHEAKVYLVSVGVADYPGESIDLKVPSRDARTITYIYYKNLKKELDYRQLLDDQATKENIISAMKELYAKAEENDQVVLFFSGHGYRGGFYAYDGYLGYGELRDAMAVGKCKNKMIFADACFSGKIRTDEKADTLAEANIKRSNVMLFLSSRSNEFSNERPDMKNGYFTTYLSKGLKGAADVDRDRVITAKELFDYVHKGVIELSWNVQHPVMWGNFPDDMMVMKW